MQFNKKTILKASFVLMVVFLPVHDNFWSLFGLQIIIQPSEIFLLMFVASCFLSRIICLKLDKYDLIALIWVAINAFSLVSIGFQKPILMEVVKPLILFLMYKSVRAYIALYGKNEVIKIFLVSVSLSCLLAITGWFLNFAGIRNVLVWQMPDYPYLGPIARARAFTSTPNMLGSLILMASLFTLYMRVTCSTQREEKIYTLALGYFVFAFLLVISKTIVVLAATTLLFFSLYKMAWDKYLRIGMNLCAVLLFLVYILASHIVVDFNSGKGLKGTQALGYIANGKQYGSIYIAPTAYTMIKSGCLAVFKDNTLFGVGAGQYVNYHNILQEKDIYNDTITQYDPHCTLLGALTELGIFGGLFLLVAAGILLRDIFIKVRQSVGGESFGILLLSLFIGICVESIVTDVMNFRQYWFLYAIIVYYLANNQRNEFESSL